MIGQALGAAMTRSKKGHDRSFSRFALGRGSSSSSGWRRAEPTDDFWGGTPAIIRIDGARFAPEVGIIGHGKHAAHQLAWRVPDSDRSK
jgi:hypothetical protein